MNTTYTLKDFALDTLPTDALDRAQQLKKWITRKG